MFFIDRQILGLQRRDWIVEAVNRQARAANNFSHAGNPRRRQDVVGHGHIKIEPFGIADSVGKLPALRDCVESGFGVRKALAGEMNDSVKVLENILERMRLTQVGRIGRTRAFSRFGCVERRDLIAVRKKLAYDELSKPTRPASDDNAHDLSVPLYETNRSVRVLSTGCCR
jgi:hypothetical protein